MTGRLFLTAAALVFAATLAPAQDDLKSAPPRFVTLAKIDQAKNELVLTELIPEMRTVTRQKTVRRDGVNQTVTFEDVEVLTKPVAFLVALQDAKIYTAAGKDLTRAALIKRLKAGTVLVLSQDGKKVDPVYLKLFKGDTLVLVGRREFRAVQLPTSEPGASDKKGAPGVLPMPKLVPSKKK